MKVHVIKTVGELIMVLKIRKKEKAQLKKQAEPSPAAYAK